MSKRFKKIALAIYLDPTQSEPDKYAYETMLDWSEKRKEFAADANAAIELHQLVHIHKDIYLSGLFLHSLKPELATSLASALSSESITSDVLMDVLRTHHILENEKPTGFDQEQLIAAISGTVQSAIEQQLPELSQPQPVQNDQELTTHANNIESMIKQNDSDYKRQLSELRELVSRQNKLIRQLSVNQTAANMDAASAGEKSVKEAQDTQSSPEQVEMRLAKVQKLKKKGVF